MKQETSIFDEDIHLKTLAEARLLLDDLLHGLETGYVQPGSKMARCADILARFYELHKALVSQTVTSALIDTLARDANKKLLLKTGALKRELFFKAGELEAKSTAENNLLNLLYNSFEIIKELKMRERTGEGSQS